MCRLLVETSFSKLESWAKVFDNIAFENVRTTRLLRQNLSPHETSITPPDISQKTQKIENYIYKYINIMIKLYQQEINSTFLLFFHYFCFSLKPPNLTLSF